MHRFPTLKTDRLILRQIVGSDVPAIFRIHSDAQHMKWFGVDPVKTQQEVEPYIELFNQWQGSRIENIRWGIQKKDGSELIGSCGLFKWHHAWKRCAVGYELALSETGQGYLSEALAVIIDWAFQHTELNRIEGLVHVANTPSIRVLTKLGFTQEGLLRQCGYWQDHFHDMLMFGLLKQDWWSQ